MVGNSASYVDHFKNHHSAHLGSMHLIKSPKKVSFAWSNLRARASFHQQLTNAEGRTTRRELKRSTATLNKSRHWSTSYDGGFKKRVNE